MSNLNDRWNSWWHRGQQQVGQILVNEAGQPMPRVITGKDKAKNAAIALGAIGAIGGGVAGIESQFGIIGNGARIVVHIPLAALHGFCEGVNWCDKAGAAVSSGVEGAREGYSSADSASDSDSNSNEAVSTQSQVPAGRKSFDVQYDGLTAFGTCAPETVTLATDGTTKDRINKVASIFTIAAGVDAQLVPKADLGLTLVPTIADSIQAGRVDEFPVSPSSRDIAISRSCIIEGVNLG